MSNSDLCEIERETFVPTMFHKRKVSRGLMPETKLAFELMGRLGPKLKLAVFLIHMASSNKSKQTAS